MKITEDVRKFAAEQGIDQALAIERGLHDKAKEFQQRGAEVTRRPDLKAFWPRLNNEIKMTVDNSSEEVHIHN